MASLWEQLTRILSEVLPPNPDEAINGTQLLAIVEPKLEKEYSENSIRQHFSSMSADPTSPIAKVDQGHGYYRRIVPPLVSESSTIPSVVKESVPPADSQADVPSPGRQSQLEEEFRSVFMRYAQFTNQFPMSVEHTKAQRQKAGVNKWKFPDVVVLRWEVGEVTDAGFRLAKELLEVKRSLGEQPFRLISTELKVELTAGSFREAFFQCVSNSKWAHSAQLAVATKVTDETVAEELRRLGISYDVSVVSYGLDLDYLDGLPAADELLNMLDGEFEAIASKIVLNRIAVGRDRETLDWEHIRDLKLQSDDFNRLFRWTAYCLERRSPYRFADWQNMAHIEDHYA
jgi:hypothetical protein